MANPFSRTLRSLALERPLAALAVLAAVSLLLGIWVFWFLEAELPLYVVSESARIEAQRAAHPVTAQVEGRIVRVAVQVGQRVAAGEVLIELEGEIEDRRLDEAGATLGALRETLSRRKEEREGEAVTLAAALRGGTLEREEAKSRLEAAHDAAELAEDEAVRMERLVESGLRPDVDRLRARSEARQRSAALDELRAARLRIEQRTAEQESDRRARVREIDTDLAGLEGEIQAQEAVLRRLEAERDLRVVRAPVPGRVAELERLDAGAVVQAGQRLGTLIPTGRLRVVASFLPGDALGRVRSGQPAEVRLEGFPWIEFGGLAAEVRQVAEELRDGRVRVELDLAPVPPREQSSIPLQHGLPGTVSVETERVSPATLLLRTLGHKIASSASVDDD